MNAKIPFHQLAAMLAESCGITPAEAEEFVKSFFDLITASLVEGSEVKVKGIGVFSRSNNPESPVTFTPDRQLAETINAPFAMFEAEELSANVTDEALAAIDLEEKEAQAPAETETPVEPISETPAETEPPVKPVPTETIPTETTPVETTPVEAAPVEAAPTETTPVEAAPVEAAPTETIAETPAEVAAPLPPAKPVSTFIPPTPSQEEEEEEEEYLETTSNEERGTMSWGWGFVLGLIVGLAVGACAVYFAIDYIFPGSSIVTSTEDSQQVELSMLEAIDNENPADSLTAPAAADTVAADAVATAETNPAETNPAETNPAETKAPEAQPAIAKAPEAKPAEAKAAPVKDTIKAGYLLPTMARKHFGNNNFWVYIYEENKSAIPNPNRVRPGLTVVIPPAEKYGIDAKNPASVQKAKEKAAAILKKYPN